MRSKKSQRIKDAKRTSRRRKIIRCHNLNQNYGRVAREVNAQAYEDKWKLGAALGHFFGQLR